jgi:hypothetical protein
MLSGRTKKDYQAEVAADSLEQQADRLGLSDEDEDDAAIAAAGEPEAVEAAA